MREVLISYEYDSKGNRYKRVRVTGASMTSREPTLREREMLERMHQEWNSEIARKQREEESEGTTVHPMSRP